jgi:hypothetical protein
VSIRDSDKGGGWEFANFQNCVLLARISLRSSGDEQIWDSSQGDHAAGLMAQQAPLEPTWYHFSLFTFHFSLHYPGVSEE